VNAAQGAAPGAELKLCECGCGQPAPIATRNDSRAGIAKGQQRRFIQGHVGRTQRKQPEPCSAADCERPTKGRGYCADHLKRFAKTGDPGGPLSRPRPIERILAGVTEQPAPDHLGTRALPCWITRPNTADGRLRVHDGPRQAFAYRFTFEEFIGPMPDELVPDHLCRRPACVNPWHLDPVPSVVNVLRGSGPTAVNAAKAACKNGHLLEGDNVRVETTGSRRCMACTRARWRRKSKNPAIASLPDEALYAKELPACE
jgi:hypothetical protein